MSYSPADDGRPFHRAGDVDDVKVPLVAQRGQVQPDAVAGVEQIVAALLDADQQRGDALAREVGRGLQTENGFAGATAARDQRRPPFGYAAVRENIESGDPGWELG